MGQLTGAYQQTIKKMEDKELLLVFNKKANYTSEFLKLAEDEVARRGYDCQNIQYESIDKLVFQHKTTEELVEIVSGEPGSYSRSEVNLAIAELEERNYDLATLIAELENERKSRKRGNVSGCMFTLNGIGTKLYGKDEQADGSYIATEWIVFLWIPLIPVASYLVLSWENTGILSRNYELNKVPLNRKQIRRTYLIVVPILLLLIFFFFGSRFFFGE